MAEEDRDATVDDFEEAGAVFGAELAKIANRNVFEWRVAKELNFKIMVGVCEMRIGELRRMAATDEQIASYMRGSDDAYTRAAPEVQLGSSKTLCIMSGM